MNTFYRKVKEEIESCKKENKTALQSSFTLDNPTKEKESIVEGILEKLEKEGYKVGFDYTVLPQSESSIYDITITWEPEYRLTAKEAREKADQSNSVIFNFSKTFKEISDAIINASKRGRYSLVKTLPEVKIKTEEKEFEDLLTDKFQKLGYEVTITNKTFVDGINGYKSKEKYLRLEW